MTVNNALLLAMMKLTPRCSESERSPYEESLGGRLETYRDPETLSALSAALITFLERVGSFFVFVEKIISGDEAHPGSFAESRAGLRCSVDLSVKLSVMRSCP